MKAKNLLAGKWNMRVVNVWKTSVDMKFKFGFKVESDWFCMCDDQKDENVLKFDIFDFYGLELKSSL